MALSEWTLSANNSIGKMTSLRVIVPENLGGGPFPVLYLLHGLSDNHTGWTRLTSLERYLAGVPLIVVMPDGGRSWYTDAGDGFHAAYETHIVRDIVNFTDNTFHTIAARQSRGIAGLSMGGYGAWKLGLKHRQLFGATVSHSGALGFASRDIEALASSRDDRAWLREFMPIFGRDPRGSDNDIFALLETIPPEELPQLRFDCGRDDFLIEDNRRLHAHLQALGIAHQYEEHDGAHDWQYWDLHIRDSIEFFKSHLQPAATACGVDEI